MKKLFLILILIIYALSIPSFVFALDSPELKIWKVNPFTRCPICGEYFTIGNNQNLSNLDLEECPFFNCGHCSIGQEE